jgi:hypothetical protein
MHNENNKARQIIELVLDVFTNSQLRPKQLFYQLGPLIRSFSPRLSTPPIA